MSDDLERRLRDYGPIIDHAASGHEELHGPTTGASRRPARWAVVILGTAAAVAVAALGIVGLVGDKEREKVEVSAANRPGSGDQLNCPAPTAERIRAGAETVAVMPPGTPAECRTLPPQALRRSDIARRFPGAQTKLVRLAQIAQSQTWTGLCSSHPCTDGLVAWTALRQGPPGTFRHSCPAGSPAEACSGSWELNIIDATGQGNGYGTNIGNADPPAEFAAWEDLAP